MCVSSILCTSRAGRTRLSGSIECSFPLLINQLFCRALIGRNVMLHRRALHALFLFCLLSHPAYGQESQSARTSAQLSRLHSRLQELSDEFPGVIGVSVRDIRTGEEISINGDRLFPMASVYKVPIMVEVFRQIEAKKFSLGDRIEVGDEQRTLGSGVLTLLSNGLRPTIKALTTLMIVLSDNEATDILLKKVGAENVTAAMRSMGLNNIRVDRGHVLRPDLL